MVDLRGALVWAALAVRRAGRLPLPQTPTSPLGLNESSKYLVLFTHIDPNGSRAPFFQLIYEKAEHYARRCGADIVVVRERISNSTAWHVNFEKIFSLRAYLTLYDRVLAADDTIYFSPRCPNLFKIVPETHVGAVREAGHRGQRDWQMYMTDTCKHYKCDMRVWLNRSKVLPINSGLMLVTRAHHMDLFKDLDDLASSGRLQPLRPPRHWMDQPYYNAQIIRHSIQVHDLGMAFNLVGSLYVRSDSGPAKRAACIMHMTKKINNWLGPEGKGRKGLALHLNSAVEAGTEMLCKPHQLRTMQDYERLHRNAVLEHRAEVARRKEEAAKRRQIRAAWRRRRIAAVASICGVGLSCAVYHLTRRGLVRWPFAARA